jgi:hypothetical protein
MNYTGFMLLTLLDMLGPELSKTSAFILTVTRQYVKVGRYKVLTESCWVRSGLLCDNT